MRYVIFVLVGLLFVASHAFGDESIQVTTSKQTYHYGDYLSISVKIQNVTSDNGVMYIIDASGAKSSPIPFRVTGETTTLDAPNSFDPTLFKEGKYKIEIDYENSKTFAEFELVDIGNIVMPFGSITIVSQWSQGKISDYIFLKYLTDSHLLLFPDGQAPKESANIPDWYMTNAKWWSDKQITDEEFVNGLQYLLNSKIIVN